MNIILIFTINFYKIINTCLILQYNYSYKICIHHKCTMHGQQKCTGVNTRLSFITTMSEI